MLISYTETGWTNDVSFSEYLSWLCTNYVDSSTAVFVVDSFRAHYTALVNMMFQSVHAVRSLIQGYCTPFVQAVDSSIGKQIKDKIRSLLQTELDKGTVEMALLMNDEMKANAPNLRNALLNVRFLSQNSAGNSSASATLQHVVSDIPSIHELFRTTRRSRKLTQAEWREFMADIVYQGYTSAVTSEDIKSAFERTGMTPGMVNGEEADAIRVEINGGSIKPDIPSFEIRYLSSHPVPLASIPAESSSSSLSSSSSSTAKTATQLRKEWKQALRNFPRETRADDLKFIYRTDTKLKLNAGQMKREQLVELLVQHNVNVPLYLI